MLSENQFHICVYFNYKHNFANFIYRFDDVFHPYPGLFSRPEMMANFTMTSPSVFTCVIEKFRELLVFSGLTANELICLKVSSIMYCNFCKDTSTYQNWTILVFAFGLKVQD